LTYSEQYHKYGNKFLNQIVGAAGDETWILFVKVEIKEQSKQWMHTHSSKKPKSLNKNGMPES
jgi:hypothetical protein